MRIRPVRACAALAVGCCAVCIISTGASVRAAQKEAQKDPSLSTVLERAGRYVTEFRKQLSGIVAEETYEQIVPSSSGALIESPFTQRRVLKSDFLLVRPVGSDRYVEFRDVFEVDGRPVRDRQERLMKLFLDPTVDTARQLRQIVDESTRYNLGNILRTVNTPTFPLLFLDPEYQPRFRFSRASAGAPSLRQDGPGAAAKGFSPAGQSAVFRVSSEMWVIAYRESRKRTVIRRPEGSDIPSRGRFWIDPDTGMVLMSELFAADSDVEATVVVSYQSEPLLGFLVPIAMNDRYVAKHDRVEGRATYGRFRQFQVQVDERLAPIKK